MPLVFSNLFVPVLGLEWHVLQSEPPFFIFVCAVLFPCVSLPFVLSVFFTFTRHKDMHYIPPYLPEAILAVQFLPPQELEMWTCLMNLAELAFTVDHLHRFPSGTQKLLWFLYLSHGKHLLQHWDSGMYSYIRFKNIWIQHCTMKWLLNQPNCF